MRLEAVRVQPEVGIEVRRDLRRIQRAQVAARDLVGQRVRVQRVCPRRVGEVAERAGGAGAAQRGRGGRAGERRHLGIDDDRLVARQRGAPQVGRVGEREQALLAERRAGVAAHRCSRRRVVEAHAGGVDVVDDDGGRSPGLAEQAERCQQRGRGRTLEAEKRATRAHGATTFAAAAFFDPLWRFRACCAGRQCMRIEPSGATVATEDIIVSSPSGISTVPSG